MNIDLVDTVARAMSPDLVRGLAHVLDEADSTIRKGLGATIPLVLAGMAVKAATPDGASSLLDAIVNPSIDPDLANQLESALATGQPALRTQVGDAELASLFGADKVVVFAQALAGVTGMRASSANGLLATATPMMFGVLKKVVDDQRLDVRGLSTLLAAQKEALAGRLQPGLIALLGFGSPAAPPPGLGGAAEVTVPGAIAAIRAGPGPVGSEALEGEPAWLRWTPWLMGVGVPVLLLLTLTPGCRGIWHAMEPAAASAVAGVLAAPDRIDRLPPSLVEIGAGGPAAAPRGIDIASSPRPAASASIPAWR